MHPNLDCLELETSLTSLFTVLESLQLINVFLLSNELEQMSSGSEHIVGECAASPRLVPAHLVEAQRPREASPSWSQERTMVSSVWEISLLERDLGSIV